MSVYDHTCPPGTTRLTEPTLTDDARGDQTTTLCGWVAVVLTKMNRTVHWFLATLNYWTRQCQVWTR